MRPVKPREAPCPMEPGFGGEFTPITFAKDQPQYLPLPALMDKVGVVITDWEPSAEELSMLLNGARVRLVIHTFNDPLQPLRVEVA